MLMSDSSLLLMTKREKEMNLYVLTFLFTLVCQAELSSASSGHAFIQTDNELRFMIDGIPLPINAADSLLLSDQGTVASKKSSLQPIQFLPPILDFDSQPIGMPVLRQVTVVNRHDTDSIQLLSISGSTAYFHCSFFNDKTLAPGANTTFDVIFLARQTGPVEHSLKIRSSSGLHQYPVFGVGSENPYRLRPLVGAKIPLNSSYSPIITMHNPFSQPLSVVEMFTSGGNVHLELPIPGANSSSQVWEIKPYETKPLMRATLLAENEMNETGYIRIKTKSNLGVDDTLIIPLEVQVTNLPGLYTPQTSIDFGVVHSHSDEKRIPLLVINNSNRPIEIVEISVMKENRAITIDYEIITVPPNDVLHLSQVGVLTYNPREHRHGIDPESDLILLRGRQGEQLLIPYTMDMLEGTVLHDEGSLSVHVGDFKDYEDHTRLLSITSTFKYPLVVYNLTVPFKDKNWVSINKLMRPLTIQPDETVKLTNVVYKNLMRKTIGCKTSYLYIYTNVSKFNVPIHIFDGKLKTIFQNSGRELDFGTLGFAESRELTFTLRNDNPINISIKDIYPTSSLTNVELLGIEEGNHSLLTRPPNINMNVKKVELRPNHFAVFKVNLTAPRDEGLYSVDIRIQTGSEISQGFYVPIKFQTSEGSVKSIPEKMVFEKTFPTKIPFKVLKIRSSFELYTEVTKVSFMPPDAGFRYEPTKNTPTVLEPKQDTVIGMIHFNASSYAKERSYAGLQLNSPAGFNWVAGLVVSPNTTEVDTILYRRFVRHWNNLDMQRSINVTVKIDTEYIKGFLFQLEAHLTWPRLVYDKKIHEFPPTQLNNLSTITIILENPSDQKVYIQILPLSLYPDVEQLLSQITFPRQLNRYKNILDYRSNVFTLQNLEKYNKKSSNPVPTYRKQVQKETGVPPHPETIAWTLKPGTRVNVNIGFTPTQNKNYTSLILIRNNLTIIDYVIVRGRGARGSMRIDEAIDFEHDMQQLPYYIKDSQLANCTHQYDDDLRDIPTYYKLVTPFTIHNDGEMELLVLNYYINGVRCSHGSFAINNCTVLELSPGESKRINMEFSPDFSSHLSVANLTIVASSDIVKTFIVTVHIPSHVLPRCRLSIPRPDWEIYLFYAIAWSMLTILPVLMWISWYDTKAAFYSSLRSQIEKLSNRETFDLGKIGQNGRCTNQSPTRSTKQASNTHERTGRKRGDSSGQLNNGVISNGRVEKKQNKTSTTTQPQPTSAAEQSNPVNNLNKTQKPNKPILKTVQKPKVENQKTNDLKTNPPPTLVSEKVNNTTTSNQRKVNAVERQTSVQSNISSISKDKHDHKNNLLKRDSSTQPDRDVETVQSDCLRTPAKPGSNGQENGKMTLSEEAKHKLKLNSKAQLKRQDQKSKKKLKEVKSKKDKQPVKNARYSRGDEESESTSTEASSTSSDGKVKHVNDWLNKHQNSGDQDDGSWNSQASPISDPHSYSDLDSESSETPTWDAVDRTKFDDLSVLSDQTQQFASVSFSPNHTDLGLVNHPDLGPIGSRKPRSSSTADQPSIMDFPASDIVTDDNSTLNNSNNPYDPFGFRPTQLPPVNRVTLMSQIQRERQLERQRLTPLDQQIAPPRFETIDDWHDNIPTNSQIASSLYPGISPMPADSMWGGSTLSAFTESIWGSPTNHSREPAQTLGSVENGNSWNGLFPPTTGPTNTMQSNVWGTPTSMNEPIKSSVWSYQPSPDKDQ